MKTDIKTLLDCLFVANAVMAILTYLLFGAHPLIMADMLFVGAWFLARLVWGTK